MPNFYGLPAFPINRGISVRQKAQAKHFFTPVEKSKTNYNLRAVSFDSFKQKRAADCTPAASVHLCRHAERKLPPHRTK